METLQTTNNTEYIDYQTRRRNDTITWLAEVLDGSMRTSFDYQLKNNDLLAEDGSSMGRVIQDGVDYARALQWSEPALGFEYRRRQLELGEFSEMIAMAKGNLPNTMVVVSDFPPELQTATKDFGGYNVTRKQTMLRVITCNKNGTITMRSQSLDRSDRHALENIYHELGFVPAKGELLGQRMHVQIDDEAAQELLIDHLTNTYDQTLQNRYGESFYAGRSGTDRRNTADFVASQADLLQTYLRYTHEADAVATKSLAAAMTERFTGQVEAYTNALYTTSEVMAVMDGAGKRADQQGTTFSGCGITLGGDKEMSALEQMAELGFGNKVCVEIKNGQRVKCPGCRETVAAIVPDKESIYCANGDCKLAHPDIKRAHRNKAKDDREQRKKQQKEKKQRDKCKQPRPAKQPERQR